MHIRQGQLAEQLKGFACAVIDSDLRDPLVITILAERNRRLLAERGPEMVARPRRNDVSVH